MARRAVIAGWLGFALAALFFYPLAVALESDIYYLQWQASDLAETTAALVVLGVAAAFIVFLTWPRSTRTATAVLVGIAALPLASLAAGILRQLPYDVEMRTAWESPVLRLGLPAAVAMLAVVAFMRWPVVFGRWFRGLLLAVSPVSLVVVIALVTSASRPSPVREFEGGARTPVDSTTCTPLLALLFDELSFSYLYDDEQKIRPEFPEIRRLGDTATHYLSVTAPGRETLSSVPSFLAGRRVGDVRVEDEGLMEVSEGSLRPLTAANEDGLFARAKRLGFRTEVSGYYLAYCELLAGVADVCRSRSFYNVSSGRGGFSPFSPVLTTLVLWPRQFPFGVLKNRAFAVWQRETTAALSAFARRPMASQPPTFRFVHFAVPHLPFVFGREGYDPPFDPLQTSPDTHYVRQLQYVDRLVGDLVEQSRRDGTYDRLTMAMFADHGFRFGGRERDPLHIPFIVKMRGQTGRVDEAAPIGGEVLLQQVLQGACSGA